MRRAFVIAAPIATGALVLLLAAGYPASSVHGSGLTGPRPPRSVVVPRLGADFRLHWEHHGTGIALRVRDGAACAPHLGRIASTAPARLEVEVDRASGPGCEAHPRWWTLSLPLPTIRAPHQGVQVLVDGRSITTGPPPA